MDEEAAVGELLPAFKKELEILLAIQGTQEAEFRWVADPPGKSVAQAYAQENLPQGTGQSRIVPVFYAEIAQPSAKRKPYALVKSLLEQFGDPDAFKREEGLNKVYRLEYLLKSSQVRFAIMTDFHNLVEDEVEWLVSLFKNQIKTVPLIAIGEVTAMERLTRANGSLARRFHRLRLPGEPPEEDPQIGAKLRRMLGLDT
jgi:hypothetical protein